MSEHLIDYKRYPLELHINYPIGHKYNSNKILDPFIVVVILFSFNKGEIENRFLGEMGIGGGRENRLPKQGKYMDLGIEIDLELLMDTSHYKKEIMRGRLDSHLKSRKERFIDQVFEE